MFIIYITLATKILNLQFIYPQNVINKVDYLLPVKMHLHNSYKFRLIPIGFTSAKNKEIFGSKFMLPWQPMPNGQLPYYEHYFHLSK